MARYTNPFIGETEYSWLEEIGKALEEVVPAGVVRVLTIDGN